MESLVMIKVFGVLSALVVSGTVWASPAQADDVQGFLNALHSRGITAGHGDGTLVTAGQLVCEYLDEGYTPMQAAREVYINTNASIGAEDAGFIVGSAIRYLCPENLDLI